MINALERILKLAALTAIFAVPSYATTFIGGAYISGGPTLIGNNTNDARRMALLYSQETIADDTDTDGDGLNDSVETNTGIYVSETDTGTDPNNGDSDSDGLNDGHEINTSLTDPNNADSDGDGLSDGAETNTGIYGSSTDTGTDPNNSDSDGDGLSDFVETSTGVYVSDTDTGTDPNSPDSDRDGQSSTPLTFTLNGDGTEYSVSGCDRNASGSLVIPSTYSGLPVTTIGDYAFDSCDSLTSITISDSVTSIGNQAFQSCTSLTSVTIPDSVTSIGNYAFDNCSSLTSIIIPSSVTSMGTNAFGGNAFGGSSNFTIDTITLPYKFAGSASLLGIPGDAEITVNFDDVSEGLLANTNFVAGISDEVTFDSSAVDQAIADEAQARDDADLMLQTIIDVNAVVIQNDLYQNEAASVAADAALAADINANAADAAVAIQANTIEIVNNAANINNNAANISANNAKVGITAGQAQNITTNTAKVGVTNASVAATNAVTALNDTVFSDDLEAGEVGIAGVITKKANGDIHIGENSLITNESTDANGETTQSLYATDALGNASDIDVTNGSDLLIDGDSVATQLYADLAIAYEAQARDDADLMILGYADQAIADSVAADAALAAASDAADANLQQQINDLQANIDAAVAQARSDGVTAGIDQVLSNPTNYDLATSAEVTSSRTAGQQDVVSSPSDYDLMGAEGVFDMRVSQPGISTNADKASMNFTIQSSNDLEEWNNEETIRREYSMPSDKNFMRVSVGPELEPEPEPLTTIATDTYGDRLVYDESNNLYVNDENTPLMVDGVNLKTDTYPGRTFYAIEPIGDRYYCILKRSNLNMLMIFDLDGNYVTGNYVSDVSAYESDFGQSLN